MTRQLFIEIMEALQKQVELDIEVSKYLGKAFPDAFSATLLPQNGLLQNALVKLIEVSMNDTKKDEFGYTWITYFMWCLDFGKEAYRLKVKHNHTEYVLSDAGRLYDFIKLIQKKT